MALSSLSLAPGATAMRRWLLVLAAGAVLLALPLVAPNNYILSLLVFINIYVIFTLGLNLLFGYAGQISLGHAAFYGIGAYTSAILGTTYKLPFALTLPAAALISGAIAYVVGRRILKLQAFYLAMATLVVGVVADRIFSEWVDLTKGSQGFTAIPSPVIGPVAFSTPLSYYYLSGAIAVVCMFLAASLVRSHVGRSLVAIRLDEVAAASTGVDVAAYKARVFALSGALAGIAGALYAHFAKFISPESFTIDLSILVVVSAVIGGIRSIWGAPLGAAFLTILPELLRPYGQLNQVIYGVILFLTLLFLPEGIAGALAALYRRVLRLRPPRGNQRRLAETPGTSEAPAPQTSARAERPEARAIAGERPPV